MISTELSTRIVLTVIIVGALAFDLCTAASSTTNVPSTKDDQNKTSAKPKDQKSFSKNKSRVSSSNDSPVSPPPATLFSTTPYDINEEIAGRIFNDELLEGPQTRLMSDSAEAGILLPYDDDFPRPDGGAGMQNEARLFPGNYEMTDFSSSATFQAKPIALRVASGKALEQPYLEKQSGKGQTALDKATYYLRNNCFGPRCVQSQDGSEKVLINSPEEWKDVYYGNKEEIQSKKFESRSNVGSATNRYEDNVLENMASNFHSQIAIPFVVVDDNSMKGSPSSSFSKRHGLGRFSQTSSTTNDPMSTEGWVKLKAMSPDSYDPFRFSPNYTRDTVSTFSKRDSSAQATNNFSKRVGVELNPESFADRWGWSANGENDNRGGGGSRLPAWLEDQLKYGNRNTDQGKDWVKLEPIPVAGVSISKWVPKGTPSQDLPTTNWQTDRDRPNGGSQWWDRIDDNRILTGNRITPFLRPSGGGGNRFPSGGNNRYPSSGGGNNRYPSSGGENNRYPDNGWGSKGSSLSSFDRYPTNSWNDIIYPDGPTSATVSWQQSGGISSYPSSFGATDSSAGWASVGGGDMRKPIVATGSWSAPPNTNSKFPSFINRFNDHRSSSHPVKQASEDDPRWVLISNSRRVTSASPTRGSDVLSYINRLHPDLDRKNAFPFYEPDHPTSHRNGKDFWPYPSHGNTFHVLSPTKEDVFQKLNATLSSLTPMLLHRGGTTVNPPNGDTLHPSSSQPFSSIFDEDIFSGEVSGEDDSKTTLINSISSTLSPLLSSTYLGDGRATSINDNAANLQQSSTSTPVRISIPGKIRQGLKNINPVYAAVGAGMIPATLAAVMPMMLGKRKRRNARTLTSSPQRLFYSRRALNTGAAKYLSISNRGAY